MDHCKLVEDLLPSYCDGMTSEQTNAFIREHLSHCPRCACMAGQMASPEPPVSDSREEFSKRLRQYQAAYRKKTRKILIICLLAILLICLLWTNSYSIALRLSGVNPKQITVMGQYDQGDRKSPDTTTLVLQARTAGGGFAIAQISWNHFLNLWYPDGFVSPGGECSTVNTVWLGRSAFQFHSDISGFQGGFETNYLYCGSNALRPIEIPSEVIPHNMALAIDQSGEHYCIHMISYDTDAINAFRVMDYLAENGYITGPNG